MITNFKEYEEAYFSEDNKSYTYDFIDNLSKEEVQSLIKEIKTWTEKDLSEGDSVLQDYYGLKVPESLLKEICVDNLNIAFEIYTQGVGDTCQRSILVKAVLSKIGMSSWPTYGEGTEALVSFMEKLKQTAPKYGITVIDQ